MVRRLKHAIALVAKLVIFIPLYPVGIVQWTADKIYDACDWIGGYLGDRLLFRLAGKIDCALGIDFETEQKERMRARENEGNAQ